MGIQEEPSVNAGLVGPLQGLLSRHCGDADGEFADPVEVMDFWRELCQATSIL
jgi:hypothetical protein